MTLAGAVLIVALCLLVVLSLTVWGLLAQVREWRAACLQARDWYAIENQRLAETLVNVARLESLVRAMDHATADGKILVVGADVQKDGTIYSAKVHPVA